MKSGTFESYKVIDGSTPDTEPLVEEAHAAADTICQANGCTSLAHFEFYWPSADRKPSRQCLPHTLWAIRVADVLGFALPVARIPC